MTERDSKRSSVENQLVIDCCRTRILPELVEKNKSALVGGFDWEYFFAVAKKNAVLPFVSQNLLLHFEPELPISAKEIVVEALRANSKRNLFLTSKLLEILDLLHDSGMPALPFKGPVLAARAYGNISLRHFVDLDILVQPRHFKKAVKLLKDQHWVPQTNDSWLSKTNWHISRKKDVCFIDEDRAVNLELHWKLSGSHFGLPKQINQLWERTEPVDLAGRQIPGLGFNDLLIYLCLHGSRHSWERFSWVCDLHELINSNHHIDWQGVYEESKQLGCENVVSLGLRLLEEFFRFEMPKPYKEKSVNEDGYNEITNEIKDRLFSVDAKPVTMSDRYLYHLQLKERGVDRLKLHYHYLFWWLKIAITPNEIDRSVLHLPRMLSPVYYLTRPVRLIYTYLLRSGNEKH